MAWIHVRHRVADYAKWKAAYDGTAEYKRAHGWQRYFVYAVGSNQTDVMVMEEFDTREHAQEFVESAFLREAMAGAGVQGVPEILVMEELDEGASYVRQTSTSRRGYSYSGSACYGISCTVQ